MALQEPFSPKNLSLAYNAIEDRLIIVASDEIGRECALLFTRRLTERFINGVAASLEKSSSSAARAPAEFRSDVVLLEHQGALGSSSPRAEQSNSIPARPEAKRRKLPAALITAVEIKPHPNRFEVVMKKGERPVAHFMALRNELHRMLELLKTKAQDARWEIKVQATWLDPVQSGITVN